MMRRNCRSASSGPAAAQRERAPFLAVAASGARRSVLAPGPHEAEHIPPEALLDDRQANSHRGREQSLFGSTRERTEGSRSPAQADRSLGNASLALPAPSFWAAPYCSRGKRQQSRQSSINDRLYRVRKSLTPHNSGQDG